MRWFKWFSLWWWKYLFGPRHYDTRWYEAVLCRIKGHPNGPFWINPHALEPDMHCKECLDDLG